MLFPVYPQNLRRLNNVYCLFTAIGSFLGLPFAFCGMYVSNYASTICFILFLLFVLLIIGAWGAWSFSKQYQQYVQIQFRSKTVTLWSSSQKEIRSINFENIERVDVVTLPLVLKLSSTASIQKEPFICISQRMMNDKDVSPASSIDVFNNSKYIVLSYNSEAYDILQGILTDTLPCPGYVRKFDQS